ncbi:RNA-binding domain-containing protein [Trichodelitschia bisporula]|uniref:Multiple RNA-binding domain-containing protein 1 n=1 Tax=Trichodelitschia bisporula TaxID=703511 RepID=A0A6G1I0E4_9PEZI|nr:RNA-binding domain-containing protein [Trichodelitschia bisporula]
MESSRIFVRNLPLSMKEDEFKTHFAQQAPITDAKFIGHRRIGYIGYRTPEDASKAVKFFNKSFIRMSRIGVELARPVADGSLNTKKHEHEKAQIQQRSKSGAACVAESPPNPLKRKRNVATEEQDPQLKEYLGVMQAPSKSKTWANDMMDGIDEVQSTTVPLVLSAEAGPESDDEYQTVPKKAKRAVSDGEEEVPAQLAVPQRTETAGNREQATVEQRKPTDETDDDWLRSRTSRLLDLVDEDGELPVRGKPLAEQSNESAGPIAQTVQPETEAEEASAPTNADEEKIRGTARLFLRNLPYSVSEDDLRDRFCLFGQVEEVHVPLDSTGKAKGFAYIQFVSAEHAVEAFNSMDGTIFQGRLLHILPATKRRENKLDEFEVSKLPVKAQKQIRRKAEAASSTFNWNALYMNADAVMSSISSRLGIDKSELLDATSSDAAVKQALAETHIIQESKNYFAENGVDLEAFKAKKRGDTAILIKNFPFGTTPDELRKLFEEHGTITRFLMPPTGTIAIVEFAQAPQARSAFKSLAYRKIKDSILFLEPAPKDLFSGAPKPQAVAPQIESRTVAPKLSTTELLQPEEEAAVINTSTLFVRNLNFTTTTDRLKEVFSPLDGFLSAQVKTKKDAKKPGQILSMGFGFLEFRTKQQAQAALAAMDGCVLEGHKLEIRASQKALDAAEERRKDDKAKASARQGTKIIIKNLPFEASKKEVRALFGEFGQLRSVRVPKKFDSSTRGFAFAEFTTPREAANAVDALRNTHLLGRKLVLEFAATEPEDAEAVIEQMQKKVGSQTNKIMAQKLMGTGRKKFNVAGDGQEET